MPDFCSLTNSRPSHREAFWWRANLKPEDLFNLAKNEGCAVSSAEAKRASKEGSSGKIDRENKDLPQEDGVQSEGPSPEEDSYHHRPSVGRRCGTSPKLDMDGRLDTCGIFP